MKANLWEKSAIFASFVGCCLIMALLCSSLATDYWVTSTGKDAGSNQVADVNFGFFKGSKTIVKQLSSKTIYDTKVVCLSGYNQCMFSCGANADERLADITDLVKTNGTQWHQTAKCKGRPESAPPVSAASDRPVNSPLGLLLRARSPQISVFPETELQLDSVTKLHQTEPEFMVHGLWVATIVFMGCAILTVLVAAMFAILNTATNPVETITGVVGLYIWNAIAMFFELLVLILWGVQFHQKLQHSVLWREEKTQQWSTDGLASLGYSYWLVFVAFILHVINMAILWFGTHQKRPKKVQIPVERGNANATNMIY